MKEIEKAKSLVKKYSPIVSDTKQWSNGTHRGASIGNEVRKENAKEAALIAVSEIIHLKDNFIDIGDPLLTFAEIGYWEKVKAEIEKL